MKLREQILWIVTINPFSCLPVQLDIEMRQSNDENEEKLAKGDSADGDRIANDIEYECEVRIYSDLIGDN